MKYTWFAIFIISVIASCETNTTKKKSTSQEEDDIVLSFSFDESPVDFTVSDSLGHSLTFHKHLDSAHYHFMRFRKPDESRQLLPLLSVIASLWNAAAPRIDIRLSSINLGYPLIYDDVLTNHIQAFSTSEVWLNHLNSADNKVDYAMVSEIMYRNNIFPLYELLDDFGYEISGFSVEKVGFIQPDQLVGLGFNPSLTIPVPYMVWIEVVKTS